MATYNPHQYITPAVQQLVVDHGLEMEAGFWTHHSSHWALVNTQFKNTKIALAQHGCPLTPKLVAYPPNYVVDFERLTTHSNLTPHQAAHKLGWTKPATSTTCWWGKRQGGPCRGAVKPGQPGFVDGPGNVIWGARYYGGLHPRTALNAHIKRQVLTNRANPNAIYIPWWGAGLPYAKILEMRAQGRAQ